MHIHGLFGADLNAHQAVGYMRVVVALGGAFLAFSRGAHPDQIRFLATLEFCGGPPCATNHEEAGAAIVAALRRWLAEDDTLWSICYRLSPQEFIELAKF